MDNIADNSPLVITPKLPVLPDS